MKHTRVDHALAAARLREQPGTWLTVGEYRNDFTARTTTGIIRTANGRSGIHYQPAGAFEARRIITADGSIVEACYVGDAR